MQRILIVKTSSMGDVVHAWPVLHDLRQHWPGCRIEWLVEAPFAGLLQAHPWVDAVHTVEVRRWRREGLPALWRGWCGLRQRLAGVQFDLVLDLQGLLKSALLACAARGTRAGPAWGYAREPLASCWYRRRGGWPEDAHAVQRLRHLAAAVLGHAVQGPPVFFPPQPRVQRLAGRSPCVWLLHATARPEKQWPLAHWQALAKALCEQGCQVQLPWGTAAEQQQALAIAQGLSAATVLPFQPLAAVQAALRSGVDAVVGVDTGLTHLAAAFELPMVALFFATPAWRYAPCFNPRAISLGDLGQMPPVEAVLQALQTVLTAPNPEEM